MDFTELPDLAVRTLGGSVLAANDELFAERENLIKPLPAMFNAHTFGHKGQIYDGWETRRRRKPGHDWAIVRLGVPGVIRGVVVDTAFFTGNFPEQCSVEATSVEGYPSPEELEGAAWTEIVPRSPLKGDTRNLFPVAAVPAPAVPAPAVPADAAAAPAAAAVPGAVAPADAALVAAAPAAAAALAAAEPAAAAAPGAVAPAGGAVEQRFTHVRLNIFPDGGVARLRVHGEVVPDPRFLAGVPLDLAALANGGLITDASNRFYSSPNNLLMPGQARVMGDGWETARRRDDANDWVEVRLAAEGVVRQVELDTTHFKGNAPGWFRLSDSGGAELIPRTRLQPDTRHLFRVAAAPTTGVRVDVYPDGGFARLRLWGDLTDAGRDRLALNWYNRLPPDHLAAVLETEAGLSPQEAAELAAARPVGDAASLPPEVARLLRGA